MSTVLSRLRRFLHRTPPARVAAHHPMPTPSRIADLGPTSRDADEAKSIIAAFLGPDTEAWPAPRHTHRDPTTGRYPRREQP